MGHDEQPVRRLSKLLLPQDIPERRVLDWAKQARIEASIDMFNAHYEQHGLIGEEFLPL